MTNKEFISIKLPTNKNLLDIRKNLNILILKVNTLIECEGKSILYAETKAIEIDWVILKLSQQAPLYPKGEPREVTRLKEVAWTLLEKLEDYTINNLEFSVW